MKKKNKAKKSPDLWSNIDALGGESAATEPNPWGFRSDEERDAAATASGQSWRPSWMADFEPFPNPVIPAWLARAAADVEAEVNAHLSGDAVPAQIPPATPDPADSLAGCPLDGPCECCPTDCDVCVPVEFATDPPVYGKSDPRHDTDTCPICPDKPKAKTAAWTRPSRATIEGWKDAVIAGSMSVDTYRTKMGCKPLTHAQAMRVDEAAALHAAIDRLAGA